MADGPAPVSSPWLRWIEWFGLPLAFVVDIATAVYLGRAYTRPVVAVLGVLTCLAGGVLLLRRRGDADPSGRGRWVFLLSILMVAAGAGVATGAVAYQPRSSASATLPAPGPPTGTRQPSRLPEGSPSGSGLPSGTAVPSTVGTAAPATNTARPKAAASDPARQQTAGPPPASAQFTGTIQFEFPKQGNTMSSGWSASGTVTRWGLGFQVWLYVQAEGSSTGTAHGPCSVSGERWTCTNVGLPGPSGTSELMYVLVGSDAQAVSYPSATTLPPFSAYDDEQAYKA